MPFNVLISREQINQLIVDCYQNRKLHKMDTLRHMKVPPPFHAAKLLLYSQIYL